MYHGPDKIGQFKPVVVKGIHENRVDVPQAKKGASICINIKSLNKKEQIIKTNSLKKGMLLLAPTQKCIANTAKKGGPASALESLCVREFEAEIVVLHHATLVKNNY